MLEIIKSIIFGIVEGITEWLPISSTGHMILLDEFIKMDVSEIQRDVSCSYPAWSNNGGSSSFLVENMAVL